LSDLGIAGLMETRGRERRHRYFTIAAYHELLAKENLDSSSTVYPDVDLTEVGGFFPLSHELFYEDESTLFRYQDSFKDTEKIRANTRKRPFKNPILADGSVKQGRPRKYPIGEDPKSLRKKGAKRKHDESKDDGGNLLTTNASEEERPKKRRKDRNKEASRYLRRQTICDPPFIVRPEAQSKIPKKRGRPAKEKTNDVTLDDANSELRPRKRSRISQFNQTTVDDLQVSDGSPELETIVFGEGTRDKSKTGDCEGEAIEGEEQCRTRPIVPHGLCRTSQEELLQPPSTELPSMTDPGASSDACSPSNHTPTADAIIPARLKVPSYREPSLLFASADVPIDPVITRYMISESLEILRSTDTVRL
jgi:hypothetical protein